MEDTVKRFKEHLEKMRAIDHASGVLYYDSDTVMPKANAEAFGRTMSYLSGEGYKLGTAPELRGYIDAILAAPDKVDYITLREAQELHRQFAKLERIPIEVFTEYSELCSKAQLVWMEAKVDNDYAAFEPYLSKIVAMTRQMAEYTDPDMEPYNAVLDGYERGLTMEVLDEFFALLRNKLAPLVHEVMERGRKLDTSFLKQNFSIDKQRELSKYLMEVMCLPMDRCTIGEVEHPFTTGFSKYDVRITTHYHEDMMASNVFSVIHEGGLALYEANIADELTYSPVLGGGVSMSIHESQSRFFENIIGRSPEYVNLIYPKIVELFPEQLKGISSEQFWLAINESRPSLIRTEADELTYTLHIMVRYELEKRLIAGTLSTKDLPAAWDEMYREYLGIEVPNDKEGVLQDSHWSGGMIGYFPSYALGSAYSAQFRHSMQKDMDVSAQIASGDLHPIVAWLTERIYRFGGLKTPKDIIRDATGEDFDPNYYIDYLTEKYRRIYELDK